MSFDLNDLLKNLKDFWGEEGKGTSKSKKVVVSKPSSPKNVKSQGKVQPSKGKSTPPKKALSKTPPPKGGHPVIQAGEKEREFLERFNGHVLSIDGQAIALNKEQQQYAAILEGNILVVCKSSEFVSSLRNLRHQLKTLKVKISKEIQISQISLISKIYSEGRKRLQNTSNSYSGDGVLRGDAEKARDILAKAASLDSNDVHIVVRKTGTEVRFRRNGMLTLDHTTTRDRGEGVLRAFFNQSTEKPPQYEPKLAPFNTRIMKGKNDYETFVPGNISSCRLSYTPQGRSADDALQLVIRLFPEPKNKGYKLEEFGYRKHHLRHLRWMRRQSEGIIITSGPTGSGKSTLCATMLQTDYQEHDGQISVQTIEDPAEIQINGAVQFSIQGTGEDERHENFTSLSSALLRNDPDVILISEIRDRPSALATFRAAMSGHRVYSTTHAFAATMIVPRVIDFGASRANATEASLVAGLIGQRLMRQICPRCSVSLTRLQSDDILRHEVMAYNMMLPDKDEEEDFFNLLVDIREAARKFAIDGYGLSSEEREIYFTLPDKHSLIQEKTVDGHCTCCKGDGSIGRTAIIETICPDQKYMDYLKESDFSGAVKHWIDNGGMLLKEHAIQKMIEGISSPNDVVFSAGNIDQFDIEARAKLVFGRLMR